MVGLMQESTIAVVAWQNPMSMLRSKKIEDSKRDENDLNLTCMFIQWLADGLVRVLDLTNQSIHEMIDQLRLGLKKW